VCASDAASEAALYLADSTPDTSAHEVVASPPSYIHLHQCLEAGIVLDGRLLMQFEGAELDLRQGGAWLCAPYEPHAARFPDHGATLVVLVFLPEVLGDEQIDGISWLMLYSSPARDRPKALSPKARERVLAIGQELREEIEQRPAGWEAAVRLGLLRLLLSLRRGWIPPAPAGRGARPQVQPNDLHRIIPALDMVMEQPARAIRLEEAARACDVSRSVFTQIFRNAMGISFARFRLRTRLAYVSHRLLTTDVPIDAIAREAGFADGSHLHRMFLKHYGRTPGDYRA